MLFSRQELELTNKRAPSLMKQMTHQCDAGGWRGKSTSLMTSACWLPRFSMVLPLVCSDYPNLYSPTITFCSSIGNISFFSCTIYNLNFCFAHEKQKENHNCHQHDNTCKMIFVFNCDHIKYFQLIKACT